MGRACSAFRSCCCYFSRRWSPRHEGPDTLESVIRGSGGARHDDPAPTCWVIWGFPDTRAHLGPCLTDRPCLGLVCIPRLQYGVGGGLWQGLGTGSSSAASRGSLPAPRSLLRSCHPLGDGAVVLGFCGDHWAPAHMLGSTELEQDAHFAHRLSTAFSAHRTPSLQPCAFASRLQCNTTYYNLLCDLSKATPRAH
ncbi:hypothetical protein GHT09_009540 [Marmota monax]|uniref:Uncharacterized protein n=1 Tax=Marmota monax TaxID=9995 RepID=A0A834UMC0_MARMO|nr:hypothetical protein GHT09_009540 [Marmota monax]